MKRPPITPILRRRWSGSAAAVAFSCAVAVTIPAAVITLVSACSDKPTSDDIRVIGPNQADFVAPCQNDEGGTPVSCGVSAMMERRCGSLDCHGYIRRPMRLYSKNGLRLIPDAPDALQNEPGGADTTPAERAANYRAVTGVEPEKTQDVANQVAAPDTLLIYKKPLGIEGHKGGTPINKGDDSETCLVSWLSGHTDFGACGKASQLP